MNITRTCSVDGCKRGGKIVRGLCTIHYGQARYRGEITNLPTLTGTERFAASLERKPNGCLEWTGRTDRDGYGRIRVGDGKRVGTHRLAWELVNGPIPPEVMVRHFVCDNPPCCDVTHLRLGTSAENTADRDAKGRGRHEGNTLKTHCRQGHAYDEANTYVSRSGKRTCRACNRIAATAIRHRNQSNALKG